MSAPSVLEIDDVDAILQKWCACVQNSTRFEEAALHAQQPRFALVVRALEPWDKQLHDTSASANRKRKATADEGQSHEQRWTQLLDAIQVLHLLLQSADKEDMVMTPDATEHLLQFLHEDIEVVEHLGWSARTVRRKDDPVDALLRTFACRDNATQYNTNVGFVLDFSGCKQTPETGIDSLRGVLQRRDPNVLCQTSDASLQKLLEAYRYGKQKQRAPIRLGLRFWNCAVSLQTLTMLRSCIIGLDSALQSSTTHIDNGTPALQLKTLDLSENVLCAERLDSVAHLIQSVHIDALSLNGVSNGLIESEAWETFLCAIWTRPSPSAAHGDHHEHIRTFSLADNTFTWRELAVIGTLLHLGASRFGAALPSNWSFSLSSMVPVLSIDKDVLLPWLAFGIFHPLARSGVTELDLSFNWFDEHDVEAFARVMASLQPPQDVWYDEPFLFDMEEGKTEDGLHAQDVNEAVPEWICLAASTVVRTRPRGDAAALVECTYSDGESESWYIVVRYWHEWVCVVVPGCGYGWVHASSITSTKVREAGLVGTSARVTSLIMDWYAATTPLGDPGRIQVVKQLLQHIGAPLESLRVRGSTLSAADVLDLLALCPRLQHLDIESCGLRDIAGLADAVDGAFWKLQSVNLRHNPLSLKDRDALAGADTKCGTTIWYFSE